MKQLKLIIITIIIPNFKTIGKGMKFVKTHRQNA